MLFFHSIRWYPQRILGYWKGLLTVTSKASVFSEAIFRHLLSNHRFACHRLSLILSSRILTSSTAHKQVRRLRSQYCSFQQVDPCAGNHHTWCSERVYPPATVERRHMSSLPWETICRPRISHTCRSYSHLLFAAGSLEPFSARSPRCRCSTPRY